MLGGLFLWLLRRRESACRRCPHSRDGHPPYDRRTSKPGFCGSCKCGQYKPEHFWSLALAFLRERPPPVAADVLHPHPVRFPVPAWCEDEEWDDDDRTRLGLRIAPYAPNPKWGP
jgi:hypothetical protein